VTDQKEVPVRLYTSIEVPKGEYLPDYLRDNNEDMLRFVIGDPIWEDESYMDGFGLAREGEYSLNFEPSSDYVDCRFYPVSSEDDGVPFFFIVKAAFNPHGPDGSKHKDQIAEVSFQLAQVEWRVAGEDGEDVRDAPTATYWIKEIRIS